MSHLQLLMRSARLIVNTQPKNIVLAQTSEILPRCAPGERWAFWKRFGAVNLCPLDYWDWPKPVGFSQTSI